MSFQHCPKFFFHQVTNGGYLSVNAAHIYDNASWSYLGRDCLGMGRLLASQRTLNANGENILSGTTISVTNDL
jgi:hypothetical protein